MTNVSGPDASPIVVPLGQFGFENQRSLPFLPQEPMIRSAPKRRLMMSWWDREVHIWRISKQTRTEDDDESLKGRKLVAKILIKGESNITCASLSSDGGLLAVSTAMDIKLFQLRPRRIEDGEGLRISKIAVPEIFSGARLVQFSPDGKWLCIIRADSHLTLARISGSSSTSSIDILPQTFKLTRLDRKIEKFVLLGGLGTYDRTITQIAFSSDSRVLAVSDLAGYIDTFMLSGIEDLAAGVFSDSDASSDSESDSEDEEEKTPKLIFGQHWTRNPSAALLPKLPSCPVLLSFRPVTPVALTNGATPPATRKTPNPIPTDIPNGEHRLLVVTGTSEVFEFDVLKGGLTPWSRRNPTSSFPEEFKKALEQIRGAVWDISNGKERVWLYSVNWIWMFDMSRDLPIPAEEAIEEGRERKRQRKEIPSGAGGNIPDDLLNTGISRKMKKIIHGEMEDDEHLVRDAGSMDVDEDEFSLDRLRRSEARDEEVEVGEPHSWHTFKYRPIMGIVVVGDDGIDGPEVAVVERPIWKADIGGRWYGEQEWRERDMML